MIELDDCGKELLLTFNSYKSGFNNYQTELKAIMVIKAPKGTMVIFEGKTNRRIIGSKCKAIRAFMEEHSNDR